MIDTADTIIETSPTTDSILESVPTRSTIKRGQTPQGFRLHKLRTALDSDLALDEISYSDNCSLYQKTFPNDKIYLVKGSERNIKITTPLDLFLAEKIILLGDAGAININSKIAPKDKNIVVFGSSSGLGKHCADALFANGNRVFSASKSNGFDVRNPKDISTALATARDSGPIDAVLNFAGILQISSLAETSYDVIDEVIGANYAGSINVAKESYSYLKESAGQLILTSSSSYYMGRKMYACYSSSKAAVVNLTQALSDEWVHDRISVNCIVPRRADTPMRRKAFPLEDRKSLLSPGEVSRQVLNLLCSNGTNQILSIT